MMASRVLGPEKTKLEKEAEKELEEFFDDCGEGTITVKVYRIDPNYGYAGEFYVTKDNPLTLIELKKRFGGRVLRLNGRASNGTFSRQKTIAIDDVPRREGMEIYPDGTVEKPGNQNQTNSTDPWAALMRCPLPPDVIKTVAPYMLGYTPDKNDRRAENPMLETMQQQAVMDMMNTQRTSQMEMMRMSMEMQREMMRMRQEADAAMKPKDAFSDVNNVVKLMREMNGLKSEFGGEGAPLAGKILEETMPLVETMFSEFLQLKKLQIQSQMSDAGYSALPRELPERTSGNASRSPKSQLRVMSDNQSDDDPVSLARRMGQKYRNMSDGEQQRMMAAFLGNEQNIDAKPDNDIIETVSSDDDSDFLTDASDRAILNGTDSHQDEESNIPNGEYSAAADDGNQTGGEGNTRGIDISAH